MYVNRLCTYIMLHAGLTYITINAIQSNIQLYSCLCLDLCTYYIIKDLCCCHVNTFSLYFIRKKYAIFCYTRWLHTSGLYCYYFAISLLA